MSSHRPSPSPLPFSGRRAALSTLPALLVLALVAACANPGAPIEGGSTPPLDPIAVYGDCAFCHDPIATSLTVNGGHGSLAIKCQVCHEQLLDIPGPGHESVPQCATCHPAKETHHDPAAGTPQQCQVCHTPHGSPNLFLVNTSILTPQDEEAPITFTNLTGKADDSFASVSDPGTGVCEVCHTTTKFYNNTGTGEPHFGFPCYTCHPHDAGFEPD